MKKFLNLTNLGIAIFGGLFCGGICKLGIWFTGFFMAALFLLVPGILKAMKKEKASYQRFLEAGIYLEQMENSFKNNQTIYDCLKETRDLFGEGEMKEHLKEAVTLMEKETAGADAAGNALAVMEEHYGCEQMKLTHDFFLKNTQNGGERIGPVEILEKRRNAWSAATEDCRAEKKKMLNSVLISVTSLFFISEVFVWFMPKQMRIAGLFTENIATVALLILLVLIVRHIFKKNAEDWLSQPKERSREAVKKDYLYLKNYDPKKEIFSSIKWAFIPLVITILCFIKFHSIFVFAIGLPLTVLMLDQHKLNQRLIKKRLIEEVERDYPKWMLSIILLMKSESVQGAIFRSIDHAPNVLKYPLEQMKDTLQKHPTKSTAYFEFLSILNMPRITESMKLLYSVSSGTGGDSEKQMLQIVDKNNAMTLKSEKLKNENRLAGITAYLFLPVLPISIKMMFDMVLIMITMYGNVSAMI